MQELTLGFPVPELPKGYVKARIKKIMSSLPGLESTGFPQGGFMWKYSYLCVLQITVYTYLTDIFNNLILKQYN